VTKRSFVGAATVVVLAVSLGGCGSAPPPLPTDDRAHLRPAADLGPDVMYRQELVVRRGGRERRLAVALQKRGDSLLLLALTPLGTRAFSIELVGRDVRFVDYTGGRVDAPFPPRAVVLDVERTLAPWLAATAEAVLADGWHEGVRDGERVRERWQAGRLYERRFVRVDRDPPGEVSIAFEGGAAPLTAPPVTRLHNGRLGYDLEVRTLERRALSD